MQANQDEELIRKIRQGDIFAYEILVRRYQQRLFGFIFRIVKQKEPTEEILLDSLYKIYKNIDKIDLSRKFSTYLFEIAKNDALSYLRKQKKEISINDLEFIDEDETIYEKLSKKDEEIRIRKAISHLEDKYQQVISLYYFEDLSYEEISAKLRIPINTIRTHLRRAKGQLKKIYEKS